MKSSRTPPLKPVVWVGSSGKDFRSFPEPVKDDMGYALFVAQQGGKHIKAKPLQGFGGAGVVEIVSDHLHSQASRKSLRASRFPEKVQNRYRNTQK